MKAKWLLSVSMVVAAMGGVAARAEDMGTAFTYQGSIEKPAGSPYTGTCDFLFGLWDDPTAGALVTVVAPATNPATASAVGVSGGVFTATMDYGIDAINGTGRWLAIEVRCPAGSGAYSLLTPRVALTPAPHALALPGLYTQQTVATDGFSIGPGSPNVIGGGAGNSASPGIKAATIAGGGGSATMFLYPAGENKVEENGATVGGGYDNHATGLGCTVGGGYGNTASGTTGNVDNSGTCECGFRPCTTDADCAGLCGIVPGVRCQHGAFATVGGG